MSRVNIIIVNWNTGKLLAQCLKSLHMANDRDLITRVVVVDNASTDQSYIMAQQVCNGSLPVTFVGLTENFGFARANNRGIAELVESDEHHLLLLNPDTEVPSGALTALVNALERQPQAGIVGPQLRESDGRVQPSVRAFPTLGALTFLLLKLYKMWPNAGVWRRYMAAGFDYTQEQFVDQVMGAAFLIRNTVLVQIGRLDERFSPYWFEEVDYCKRAADAGWRVLYTPTAQVIHYGGVSFHQLVGWRKSWPWMANALRYTYKHIGFFAGLLLTLLLPLFVLVALPAQWQHKRLREMNKARL